MNLGSVIRAAVPQSIAVHARRLMNKVRRRKWLRERVGQGTYLDPTVQVIGMRDVRIGRNTQVGEASWLNVNARSTDGAPRIRIGDNCLIGRRNLVSSAASIDLGDCLLTGSDCAFIGADHIIDDPLRPYISTGATSDGVIIVEPNCWFGIGATVIGAVHIGRGSVIGARSTVLADVPPFSLVIGSPGRVIKRYSFVLGKWLSVDQVQDEASLMHPGLEEYSHYLLRTPVILPRLASGWRLGDEI